MVSEELQHDVFSAVNYATLLYLTRLFFSLLTKYNRQRLIRQLLKLFLLVWIH